MQHHFSTGCKWKVRYRHENIQFCQLILMHLVVSVYVISGILDLIRVVYTDFMMFQLIKH